MLDKAEIKLLTSFLRAMLSTEEGRTKASLDIKKVKDEYKPVLSFLYKEFAVEIDEVFNKAQDIYISKVARMLSGYIALDVPEKAALQLTIAAIGKPVTINVK